MKRCRTAQDYRLFALPNTTPPKPGLVREPGFAGPGLEVEVWSLPSDAFGRFVAKIPAPLGIGKISLEDGTAVSGFLCEAHAVAERRGDHPLRRLAGVSRRAVEMSDALIRAATWLLHRLRDGLAARKGIVWSRKFPPRS